jgi:hypothetical protein
MYYRMAICQLFLRCNCYQRLIVEIEHGQAFLKKFRDDTNMQDDVLYFYQAVLIEYQYNVFQVIVLQRTRTVNDARRFCQDNIEKITRMYDEQTWNGLDVSMSLGQHVLPSAKEKRQLYEQSKQSTSKEHSDESQSTATLVSCVCTIHRLLDF